MSALTCKHCGRELDLFCNLVDGICEDEEWGHIDHDGYQTYFADCKDPELSDNLPPE